jgi:glycosyltransferase involved in cell wall biosynthesis
MSEEERLKIWWVTASNESNIGNVYGYRTHNETLRKYVERIAELTHEADDALMITVPEFYDEKIPGKVNWLFTMFEGLELPEIYKKNIQKADFLITPSTWVRDTFANYFDPKRIFVVSHGVESDFTYKKRKVKRRFRYLWVGAPNPRKGWQELAYLWDKVGMKYEPTMELYLKTTGLKQKAPIEQRLNVILDNRDLSKADLVKLYHSAHCFVFPTRGEGFGLTLAEAMRTGMPCIATNFSGVTDFFDESVGYPTQFKIAPGDVSSPVLGPLGKIDVAYSDVEDLFNKMIWVKEHYKKAREKGKAASIRIARDFTWDLSARKLVDIIRTYGGNNGPMYKRRSQKLHGAKGKRHRQRRHN